MKNVDRTKQEQGGLNQMEISLKQQVAKYWDNTPCGTDNITFAEGSLEFFEEIENRRYELEPFIHSFAQFTRWRGKKVLEVGCGAGTDLLQFARAGANVMGVDISSHSVTLTKKRLELYGLEADIRQADSENLPFPPNEFDLVYSWGVIHHTPDTEKAISEIHRVLKPGGNILIMIYNKNSINVLKHYLWNGPYKGKIFASLSKIVSENIESPGTKAHTIKEARQLFSLFSNVEIKPVLTFYDRVGKIAKLASFMNLLTDRFGWFILIKGKKPFNRQL